VRTCTTLTPLTVGFFAPGEKLCACAACELLAKLLALKRFNGIKWPQRFSRGANTEAIAVPYHKAEESFEQ